MTDSQAELEHINLQRKKHSTLNYAVTQEMEALITVIPELIDMKKGIVEDDIKRFHTGEIDPVRDVKQYRNKERISKLEAVHKAILEYKEADGEVGTTETFESPHPQKQPQ